MTPCFPGMDIPASRYFKDMNMLFLPKYLNYAYEQDTYKSFPVETPMMSHDSNDTMFPWRGALPLVWTYVASRSFDDKNMPFLQKSLNYVDLQDWQKNSQMNIQWNSYDGPRFQRHPVPLAWTYQLRDRRKTIKTHLFEIIKLRLCAGCTEKIPK